MMINMIHVWLHMLEVLMCSFVGLRSNVHTVWPMWYSILTHWWNDPPVRLLYSIFDLGYYVILISDIGNGNGTIEQHPLPLPPPPRLLHDSATIWRICFICATNNPWVNDVSCTTFRLIDQRSRSHCPLLHICCLVQCTLNVKLCYHVSFPFCWNDFEKILIKYFRKYTFNFHVMNAVVSLISNWKL